MNSGLFKNVTYKLFIYISYIWYNEETGFGIK